MSGRTAGEFRERTWRPDWPCPVAPILGVHRRGAGDPTYRIGPGGEHRRAIRTPEGAAVLEVRAEAALGVVRGRAWGPGADWALETMPRLLGAEDDPGGFDPSEPVLGELWRRFGHVRIGSSGLVFEALLPAMIEQRVTGQEAFGAFRALVRRFGEPAPGPAEFDLRLQPEPAAVRSIASWEWLKLPVDRSRSAPLVAAARVAASLERQRATADLDRGLRSLSGIGVWTSAEVRARARGDADALSVGDYHVAKNIGWALTGRAVDDDTMVELLERYRPHRYRVQRLVELAGLGPPRRGPRMAPRTHLPKH